MSSSTSQPQYRSITDPIYNFLNKYPPSEHLIFNRNPEPSTLSQAEAEELAGNIAKHRTKFCNAQHIELVVPIVPANVKTLGARSPAQSPNTLVPTSACFRAEDLLRELQGISVEAWVVMLNVDISNCTSKLDMLERLLARTPKLPIVRRSCSLRRLMMEAHLSRYYRQAILTANDLLSEGQKVKFSKWLREDYPAHSVPAVHHSSISSSLSGSPSPSSRAQFAGNHSNTSFDKTSSLPGSPLRREATQLLNRVSPTGSTDTVEADDGASDAEDRNDESRPLIRPTLLPRHLASETLKTWGVDEQVPQEVLQELKKPGVCYSYTARRPDAPVPTIPRSIFVHNIYLPRVRYGKLSQKRMKGLSAESTAEMVLDLIKIPTISEPGPLNLSKSSPRRLIPPSKLVEPDYSICVEGTPPAFDGEEAADGVYETGEMMAVDESGFDEEALEEYLDEFGNLPYTDPRWPLHLASRVLQEREQVVKEFADAQKEVHGLLAEVTLLEVEVKRQQEVTRRMLAQATGMAGPGLEGLLFYFKIDLAKQQEKERKMLAHIRAVETRMTVNDANIILPNTWKPFVPTLEQDSNNFAMDVDAGEPEYFSHDTDENPVHEHAPFRAPLTEEQLAAQARFWEKGDPELSHVDLKIDAPLASDEELSEQQEHDYPKHGLYLGEAEPLMENMQWEEGQDDSQQHGLEDRDYEYNIGIIGSSSVYNAEHPTPEAGSVPPAFFNVPAYGLQYPELDFSAPIPYEQVVDQQESDDPKDELGAGEVETLRSLYAQASGFEGGSEPRLPPFYLAFSQPSPPGPSPLLPPTTPSRGTRVNTDTPSTPSPVLAPNPFTTPRPPRHSLVTSGKQRSRRIRSPRKRAVSEMEDSSEIEEPRSIKKLRLEEDSVLSTLNDAVPNHRKYNHSSARKE
ncbi:hypothetical protein ABKN59_007468 [Abortiporus biennis]